MKSSVLAAVLALGCAPALADGHADAGAGEANFRKCQSCHVVEDGAGNVLAGKAGRTGPNLFGVIGRAAGSVEGFRYQPGLVAAGAAGLIWDEATLAAYLLDPTGFLRDRLGDSSARSAMSFRLRQQKEAADMAAFLAGFPAQ